MSSCFRSWSCSASHWNVPKPPDQHQLSPVTGGRPHPPPGGTDFTFRRQLEARLNNSWRTALFIKWYAVLINVVEACFAIYEIGKQNRLREWARPVAEGHLPDGAVRRKLHMAMATLTLLSNGAAIVGLLTPNATLLLPYYYLHVATLLLELNYAVTRAAMAVSSKSGNRTSSWRTLATLAYIAFNLLIMIGAEFGSTREGEGGGTLWPGNQQFWHRWQ